MVREIAFWLSVTPLTSKIYSYFKLQVDNDTAWTTELIPGSAEKFIGFRTNFLSSSSNVLILLYGAKVEFGVVKDAERISSATLDISNWRDGDEMEVVFWIENLKVATMRASTKEILCSCETGEALSSFRILDRYSNQLNLLIKKKLQPSLSFTKMLYLKSLESFYRREKEKLGKILSRSASSDMSILLVNRLSALNFKQMEWIQFLKENTVKDGSFDGSENNDFYTCVLTADDMISETTIKIHCPASIYDAPPGKIPTVENIAQAYSVISAQNFEHQLTHCASAIMKDLEGFKAVAKSCIQREESVSQVKMLFQRTKATMTQARDVIFNLQRVSKENYGPNSPQVEILDNCVGKLTFIIRKNLVHIAQGPYLKNVSLLYDQIIEVIQICKHIIETFQPIAIFPIYTQLPFIDALSKILTLVQNMISKWTHTSDSKQLFLNSILPFMKKNGFLFRIYVPKDNILDLETIQALCQIRIHFHSLLNDPEMRTRLDNALLHISLPVDEEVANQASEISVIPLILAYTSTKNIKPSAKIRIQNLQLIERLETIYDSIPPHFRPCWATQLKSEDWISVKELTHRVRWIEYYLTKTNHGIFGCCWLYHHKLGDFSENEIDVLESEAGVMTSY